MTVYYVDSSSSAASDRNSGVSASAPLASLAAVNKLALRPGDTVAFKAGTSCAASASNGGALTITASGTASAPITFTTYGSGPAAVIGNTAAGYSDAIQVANAQHVVIDGLKLADAGQAGINVTRTSSHVTIRNVEATHVGEGVMLNGTDNLVTHSDFHDLTMVKNTANVFDDDYGAIGVMIGNSNNEVSFTKIVNAKAPSYDYGQDGGGIELFGTLSNIRIHDNWVENSEGFIEAGGNKSSLSNVSIVNNVSLNNGNFLTLHNGGGAFASSFSNFDVSHNTVVEQNNATKQMANVFMDAAYQAGQLSFHDNAIYLNSGDSFFKQVGNYHYNNVFYKLSSATHLYNNWSMALNSGESFATLPVAAASLLGATGTSIVQQIAAQAGGMGASLTSSSVTGLLAAAASAVTGPADQAGPVGGAATPTVQVVQHADKSYEVLTAGIVGKDYASTLAGYDATGKLVLSEQFRADGSLLTKQMVGADTVSETYGAGGVLASRTVRHADTSSDSYIFGVTGKDYASALTSYDASGKVTLVAQFRADGSLLSKKSFGTDTVTETYGAGGALASRIVQHADTSYDSYAFGVTGKDYASALTSYDASGKVTLIEQFRADGSLLSKKSFGADTVTETYGAGGALASRIVQHADKSYDSFAFGVTGKDYASALTSYDGSGRVTLVEQFRADGSLLSKKSFGTDTVSETYGAGGALANRTVQHADASYDTYAFVTGQSAAASHTAYGVDGSVLYTDRTLADGSHGVTINASNVTFIVNGSTGESISLRGQNDRLIFEPSFGSAVITGFQAGNAPGHDVIDVKSSLAADFSHLTSLMHQSGSDTLIAFSPSDQILIKGVNPAGLTSADFGFH
ncbi:hypothetical protein [Methylobacterium sp. JK268]